MEFGTEMRVGEGLKGVLCSPHSSHHLLHS